MTTWTISPVETGQRLDLFFVSKKPDISRATVQKLIKQKSITVNQKKVTVHHFLKAGDVVAWQEEKTVKTKPRINQVTAAPFVPVTTPLAIIEETPDWLVINKPAGLLVHPDAKTKEGTLVDQLVAHDPKIGKIGEDPERPGIVHRLDREVSGLMVIAKTPLGYDSLKAQFASHTTKKTYLALVHGEMPQDEGDIKFRIARSATKARMAARPVAEEGGKAAWTHYRVKERFVGAALVELEILSGRTHQIRAHLHALQHPIIGDTLYSIRRTDRKLTTPRLMLQSIGLEFDDPKDGARRIFSLPPDPSFNALIEELRRS